MIKMGEVNNRILELEYKLRERKKELNGVYSLGKLTDEIENFEQLFNRFLTEIVPPSMQFSEKTFGVIEFDRKLFHTKNITHFTDIAHIESSLIIKGVKRGFLAVGYTEDLSFIPVFEQKLIDSYAERLGKIIERIEVKNEIKSNRDQLYNIINSASECIIAIDVNGGITAWNKTFEKITGYKKSEISGLNLIKDELPCNLGSLDMALKSCQNNKRKNIQELEIKDKSGNLIILLSTISVLDGGGFVLIGRNVTSERNLAHRISNGKSYLFKESIDELIKSLDLVAVDFEKIIFLTREENHISLINSKVNEIQMSENIFKDVHDILTKNEKTLILINRMDFLLMRFGFDKFLNEMYKINDMIKLTGCTLIINLNEKVVDEKEKIYLSEEFLELTTSFDRIQLDQKKLDVLKYVYNKNLENYSANFSDILNEFNITRVTNKKWMDELQLKGLVRIYKDGNSKYVNLTEKGKKLITV